MMQYRCVFCHYQKSNRPLMLSKFIPRILHRDLKPANIGFDVRGDIKVRLFCHVPSLGSYKVVSYFQLVKDFRSRSRKRVEAKPTGWSRSISYQWHRGDTPLHGTGGSSSHPLRM